jgi:hypothetical protein
MRCAAGVVATTVIAQRDPGALAVAETHHLELHRGSITCSIAKARFAAIGKFV